MDLEKRDTTMPRGIIDPKSAANRIKVVRHPVSAELAPFFDNVWIIDWDLSNRPPEEQRVLPAPNTNVVITAEGALIFGVVRATFERTLAECGRVVGLRFRPGGLRPFLKIPLATLTDKTMPAASVFGEMDEAFSRSLTKPGEDQETIAALEQVLRPDLPAPDPAVDEISAILALARRRGGPTHAEKLAAEAGVSLRLLQRRFHQYVGVSPKWVIRRYRLQEAAFLLSQGADVPLAELAVELGYFDQAHLARDFRNFVGCSPSAYQQSQRLLGDLNQGR